MTRSETHSFEFARKSVHLISLCVPLVTYYSVGIAQLIILFFILFYSYSEFCKVRGKPFFAHALINKMQRDEELKMYAKAPLFLAIGVLMAITFFTWKAALVGIYYAGFCDTVAALAGKKWGKTTLPLFTRKTYLGSLAFLVAALPVSFYFFQPSKAIILSIGGAFLESLPFKDWDNLILPIVITFIAAQFFY